MSTLLKEESETRIVLENVSWEIFVALADERRGSVPRLSYNEGFDQSLSRSAIAGRRNHLDPRISKRSSRDLNQATDTTPTVISSVASHRTEITISRGLGLLAAG
ncbi:MAG: hypothetical protein ACK6DQ_09080 [Planctomycetota bacterium]|jgi:hypothetical protein